jgi:predicted metalloprotease
VPQSGTGGDSVPGSPNEEREVQFVDFVQGDAQGFWTQQFQAAGKPYQRAKLVLFRGQVQSGCGLASSATGPFYCPLDQRVYIDLGFFDELNQRFQAPGDFAQAYVLTHEIGHHIQQQLGIEQKVRQESQANPDDANELSVRLELQADCLAGVWARSTYDRGILESGDLQEGLTAAAAVGDDRIQQQAQGRIDPESFTHGTSEQRAHWLQTGFDSGKLEACDTFSGDI